MAPRVSHVGVFGPPFGNAGASDLPLGCDVFIDQFLNARTQTASNLQSRIRAQQALAALDRCAQDIRDQHLQECRSEARAKCAPQEELERIQILPAVAAVWAEGEDLVVRTHPLITTDVSGAHTRHHLQPVYIRLAALPTAHLQAIGPDRINQLASIQICSIDSRLKPHPHALSTNSMCWGYAREPLTTLLAQQEISAVIVCIIAFLECFDSNDSAGKIGLDLPRVKNNPGNG